MYGKILLTHDGSVLADAAVPHAAAVARVMGASVVVLHVVESVGEAMVRVVPGAEWVGQSAAAVEVAEAVAAEERTTAVSQVEDVTAALQAAGVGAVSTAIVEGLAGPAIVKVAEETGCDLIVIATHGRSGLRRALLGSVADYVVRHAPCPVLLCRPQ